MKNRLKDCGNLLAIPVLGELVGVSMQAINTTDTESRFADKMLKTKLNLEKNMYNK